jgi:putative ABC transport system permease protein
MPVLPRLTSFFRTLTRGPRLDAELDDELRAYVDLLTEEKIAAGLTPEAARRAALVEVGGVEQVKEQVRDVRVGVWLDTVWQDVRYAVRGFRRSPWFTATAVASLAIGIGLNSAIFSAIEAVILRPLPYPDPDRVVSINQVVQTPWGIWSSGIWAAVFDEWQRRSTVFESMGINDRGSSSIVRDGATVESVDVLRVSSGYMAALGVAPALGRPITAEDDRPGSNVALVTDGWWRHHEQGDRKVLGRSVEVDGVPYTIVGVMPAEFRHFHSGNEVSMGERTSFQLFLSDPWVINPHTNRWMWASNAIGRLKAGVTLAAANAEVKTLAATTDYGPPPSAEWGHPKMDGAVVPLDVVPDDTRRRLWLISGTCMLVLILAATNIANLLLARAGARREEIGVRAALGASRGRLVRQFLTESVLLSFAGGLGGLVLALWSKPLLTVCMPDHDKLVRLADAGVDWRVVMFTGAVAVGTGIGFGVLPALRGSRGSDAVALGRLRRSTADSGAVRMRSVLLIGQLGLSLVLLAGAGLMIATLSRLLAKPLGYDPDGLITFFVAPPLGEPYVEYLGLRPQEDVELPPEKAPLVSYWKPRPLLQTLPERLVDRLRRVPGVIDVTAATSIPMFRSRGSTFTLPGHPALSDQQRSGMFAWRSAVTPGYFSTLGIALLSGRDISAGDRAGSPPVAIINRGMARKYWLRESDALGAYLTLETDGMPREIVGIVNDVRFWLADTNDIIFTPHAQAPSAPGRSGPLELQQNIAVRASSESGATIGALRRAVAEVTGGLPVERVRTSRASIMENAGDTWALTLVLSSSAGLALLLAAIGVFGVASYTVSQRTHEIGIRMALGASRRAVLRLVLAGGARLAVAGVLIGSVGAYWASKLIAGELHQTSPTDPRVFAAVVLVLVGVVLLATWLPARRAAAVDPVIALRAE